MTKLITITPNAEETMAYVARVSNPNNQSNPNIAGLLKYCALHGHWSVFEQAHLTIEINTTRGIAAQILRHKSFCFQEFSQRYANTNLLMQEIPVPDLRRQDTKNRQNSIPDLDPEVIQDFQTKISKLFEASQALYQEMLDANIAKECARFILPLATPTRLYMTGSVRSWIHYINLRAGNGTQKEHADIANSCKEILKKELPVVSEAMGWNQ